MTVIEEFLREIDGAWGPSTEKIGLRVIGSTALMLQTSYHRGTKDTDILETDELTDEIRTRLLELAGHETAIYKRRHIYVDVVRRAIAFRRQNTLYIPLPSLNASLRCFQVEVMSIVDVVISKLARFNPNDKLDIDAMIGLDLVTRQDVVNWYPFTE